MRRLSWRSVPITNSPPAASTSSWSFSTSARISILGRPFGLVLDPFELGIEAHFQIAAQLNVGAASGHVGGDGHGAGHTGLADDHGFALVVARVEHFVGDICLLERFGNLFDFSIDTVPTRTGWPRSTQSLINSLIALYFSPRVR